MRRLRAVVVLLGACSGGASMAAGDDVLLHGMGEATLVSAFKAELWDTRRASARLVPTDGHGEEYATYFGGTPLWLPGESWPRGPTGRPMTFVGQLAKDAGSAQFMGDIGLIRVFIDYPAMVADQPGWLGTMVTNAYDNVAFDAWPNGEVEALMEEFGEHAEFALVHPRTNLAFQAALTLNESLRLTPPGQREPRSARDAREGALEQLVEAHPEAAGGLDASYIGGHPVWAQNAEPQVLPFFAKLTPDDPLMILDGGHLYLFVDTGELARGVIGIVQSH